MDGGAVTLKSSQAAEGGDTQSQTHKRDHHPTHVMTNRSDPERRRDTDTERTTERE